MQTKSAGAAANWGSRTPSIHFLHGICQGDQETHARSREIYQGAQRDQRVSALLLAGVGEYRERPQSTTVNSALPLAPWILQNSSHCQTLPKRFGRQPEKIARRSLPELHRQSASVWRAGGQRCMAGRPL